MMVSMEQLHKAYRKVFSGSDGELVLADILGLLGDTRNTNINPECIAVANTIKTRLGAIDENGTIRYARSIIEAGQ